jgi:hypothetical protein
MNTTTHTEVSAVHPALATICFHDHSGADLGGFSIDPERTVAEMLEDVVEESGLPRTNWDGSPKRYEAYHRGRKLSPDLVARDCGIEDEEPVEIFPSVVTGSNG